MTDKARGLFDRQLRELRDNILYLSSMVQDAIERIMKNRTVLVIAHRLSTVLASDKIVVLADGKIVGMRKHNDLLQSCEQYQTLYKLQFADHIE